MEEAVRVTETAAVATTRARREEARSVGREGREESMSRDGRQGMRGMLCRLFEGCESQRK